MRVGEDEVLAQPVIVFCVAISALEEVLQKSRSRFAREVLVMDTCSVKTHPVRLMERLLPPTASILGTHPMFGPDSAHNGPTGLPMVLCPARIASRQLEEWRMFFSTLGLSVFVMTPDEHDREAAFTQGVAHYIGRVLSDLGVRRSAIGTVGYNKLLDIVEQTCNDPFGLFLDLQRYNPYTHEMRTRLEKSLHAVLTAIDG
jgi:prephenate dehydrogenase